MRDIQLIIEELAQAAVAQGLDVDDVTAMVWEAIVEAEYASTGGD